MFWQMQITFYHNRNGATSFTGNLKSNAVHRAMTLHPFKRPAYMYRMHSYVQGLRAQEMRQTKLSLRREIALMKSLLLAEYTSNEGYLYGKSIDSELSVRSVFDEGSTFPLNKTIRWKFLSEHDLLGSQPHVNKVVINSREDLQVWNLIEKGFHSVEHAHPNTTVDSAMRGALNEVVVQVIDRIHSFARLRGQKIRFQKLLYTYSRINAVYGHELIMGLMLIYDRQRDKKMVPLPVLRHLYVQRPFTDCVVREIHRDSDSNSDAPKSMDDVTEQPLTSEFHWRI